jgi:hypothetical protein
MRLVLGFIASLMVASAVHAEGLPLPWPFPWARECAISWDSMQGRYALSEDYSQGEIDLHIRVVVNRGARMAILARYDRGGSLLSSGSSYIYPGQRSLYVHLKPAKRNEPHVWARIRMHFWSWSRDCRAEALVPILTLEKGAATGTRGKKSEYRLNRVLE